MMISRKLLSPRLIYINNMFSSRLTTPPPASSRRLFSSSSSSAQKPRRVRVVKSDSQDVKFNLAVEELLWSNAKDRATTDAATHEHVLYLWQNEPCVIVGRHQNPHSECHLGRMQDDDIVLARRKSGGGAVYEDLGNSVFSFIGPSPIDEESMDNQPFLQRVENESGNFRSAAVDNNHVVLLNALHALGVSDAMLKGRNDMVIPVSSSVSANSEAREYRKISGAAFQKDMRRELLLHHGTMLLNVNIANVAKYLSPDKAKLQSKGIKSIASRVVNLVDVQPELDHQAWCEAMITAFHQQFGHVSSVPIETIDESLLAVEPKLAALYEEYCSWEFIYGNTPDFSHQISHRFSWGLVDIHLQVQDNMIHECMVFGDVIETAMMDALPDVLQGVEYSRDAVTAALTRYEQAVTQDHTAPPHCVKELRLHMQSQIA